MAHRMLRNAGAAPPWIESDKEARRLLGEIELRLERAERASPISRPRLRSELTRLADDANRAILRLNSEAPTLTQHRRPVDVAELLGTPGARLRRTLTIPPARRDPFPAKRPPGQWTGTMTT